MGEIVKVLLEKETLEREEFEALMEGAKLEEKPTETTLAPSDEGSSADEIPHTERRDSKPTLEPGVA